MEKDQHSEMVPGHSEDYDSPTIQHLIEQLDRDLEETRRNESKAQ